MKITFEAQRLYVAPRKSVLFFARVSDEKIRCYVRQDALIEPARGLREESDVFQRCLLAFDQYRGAIESAAVRLIDARQFDTDGAVTIHRITLALETEPSVAALGAGRNQSAGVLVEQERLDRFAPRPRNAQGDAVAGSQVTSRGPSSSWRAKKRA